MGNEIITTQKAFTLVAANFQEAMEIAKTLSRSDLVPKEFRDKPENCFVAIQWGQEIGLAPLQALQNIAVINGRPCLWGDAALALVSSHSSCEDVVEAMIGSGDAMVARCTVKRKNRSPVVREFAVTDAKRAGLWSKQGPWTNYPQRMLQLRARAFALRDSFPDVLKGIGIAEEQQDIVELNQAPAQPQKQVPEIHDVDVKTGEVLKPHYADDAFDANYPKWIALIESGKKTAEQIIAMVESKAQLSVPQRDQILSIKVAQ